MTCTNIITKLYWQAILSPPISMRGSVHTLMLACAPPTMPVKFKNIIDRSVIYHAADYQVGII